MRTRLAKPYPAVTLVITLLLFVNMASLATAVTTSSVMSLPRCTSLPEPRQMHGAAVIGNRLYVFGGEVPARNQKGEMGARSVLSAEIWPDGKLLTWKTERPLPECRSYISGSVEVVNNRIYIISGLRVPENELLVDNYGTQTQDVLWTSVQSDGGLAEWTKSQPFPGLPVDNAATCSNEKFLFLLGGQSGKEILDTVRIAEFAPDGSPTKWRAGTPLPCKLWFHGAAILENLIYVWGGLKGASPSQVNDQCYSAPVASDGTIGQWKQEGRMPNPVYSAGFCGFNDYLVAIAGRFMTAAPTNSIHFAMLNGRGVGQWQQVNTDLDARVFHAVGLDRSRGILFVTGGRMKTTARTSDPSKLLDTVQAFRLSQSSRLDSSRIAQAPPAPAVAATAAKAVEEAAKTGKPCLLLFYSPEVPACRRLWDSVITNPKFAEAAKPFQFGMVDVNKETNLCYKYGVFKAPALAVLSRDGKVERRSYAIYRLEDALGFLAGK